MKLKGGWSECSKREDVAAADVQIAVQGISLLRWGVDCFWHLQYPDMSLSHCLDLDLLGQEYVL